MLYALDAADGRELWASDPGHGIVRANAMTDRTRDGRQMVVVAARIVLLCVRPRERADADGGEARVSLTLFRKKRFAGKSHPVTRSHGNLRVTPVGYRTRSLTMTSEHDRALLFSKKMYRGKVAFAAGVQDVPKSADTFFKPLRSVRIDPFRLYLNVTVVCSGGEFPGSWNGRDDALASIDTAIDWANRVWATGLLWLERRKTEVRDVPRKFEL